MNIQAIYRRIHIDWTEYFKIFKFFLFLLIASCGLWGCAGAGKNETATSSDMTMAEIYQKETGLNMDGDDVTLGQARQKLQTNVHYSASTRTQLKQIHHQFKQLPNPEIALYVAPHFVDENGESEPVPGYTSAFFLYRKNHFATASERY